MLNNLKIHDILALIAAVVSLYLFVVKLIAIVLVRDRKILLRIIAIVDAFYMTIILVGHVIGPFQNDETAIILAIPGVIILMALEAAHGVLDIQGRKPK